MGKSTSGVRLVPLFNLFLIGLATFLSTTVNANNLPPHTVSGVIKDTKNEPLSGVSIIVKGTTNGTTTNAEGKFTLTDVPDNGTLVISFTGYASQDIAVKGKSEFLVSMELTTLNLDEVVVTGYGTRAKKDVTGAISQIKVTQLENENPPSVQDALRGNTPGLVVTSSPTAKGGGNLQIRGRASISGVSSPLIVLDGVIYQGDLSDINPNDIATIDILKDASSAAVFGAKAASGVILVTTKKGSGNKPTIGFNANVGLAKLAMDEPLYDGPGFVHWRSDVLKSQNIAVPNIPYKFDDPRTLPGWHMMRFLLLTRLTYG
jgi:TonB-dependent SusC/RagA subfamily outer membrane receptor